MSTPSLTDPQDFPHRAARILGVALDRLMDVMAVAAGLLLVVVTVLTFVAVIMRQYAGSPLAWAIEVTEFSLLYITFLGAPWVLKQGGHVRIDVVVTRLPTKARQVLHVVAAVIGIGVCLVLAYYGGVLTYRAWERGVLMLNILAIPRYQILWVIPFGCIVLVLQFLRMLFHPAEVKLGSSGPEGDVTMPDAEPD